MIGVYEIRAEVSDLTGVGVPVIGDVVFAVVQSADTEEAFVLGEGYEPEFIEYIALGIGSGESSEFSESCVDLENV